MSKAASARTTGVLRQVDLVRLGARRVPVDSEYRPQMLADVSVWVEKAGMGFALGTTAREYTGISSREELAVTLAGRVGNARVAPNPPLWPLLGILLLGWRESLDLNRLQKKASERDNLADVERGLAIIAHLFPELAFWLAGVKLNLPRWEQRLAVPVAARRLTAFDLPD